jgi:hypothetical protein
MDSAPQTDPSARKRLWPVQASFNCVSVPFPEKGKKRNFPVPRKNARTRMWQSTKMQTCGYRELEWAIDPAGEQSFQLFIWNGRRGPIAERLLPAVGAKKRTFVVIRRVRAD